MRRGWWEDGGKDGVGGMDGWMDGMDGWMDGWMERERKRELGRVGSVRIAAARQPFLMDRDRLICVCMLACHAFCLFDMKPDNKR